jgi:hypothetical protein
LLHSAARIEHAVDRYAREALHQSPFQAHKVRASSQDIIDHQHVCRGGFASTSSIAYAAYHSSGLGRILVGEERVLGPKQLIDLLKL